MPRVAPLYRFIQMYHLETRKMRFGLSIDAARQEALRIWDTMTKSDKKRFKDRIVLYDLEALPVEALSFYEEIETSSDELLRMIAYDAVASEAEMILKRPTTPIFFLQVCESASYLGYPEELTIVRFSLVSGVENYFHALFDIQRLDAQQLNKTMEGMKSKLHVVPIRNHKKEARNMRDLSNEIRSFLGYQKLFTQHTQTRAGHAIMQLVDRVDFKFEHPLHEIFEAETLLSAMVKKALSERDLTQKFWKVDKFGRGHLACDFHQACGRSDRCTLLNGLLLAQNFGEIFARQHRWQNYSFLLGYRPEGIIFTGSGKYHNPAKLCEDRFDGVFRVPSSV